jgi:hypothetical protein
LVIGKWTPYAPITVIASQPASQPACQPASQEASQPASQPASQHVTNRKEFRWRVVKIQKFTHKLDKIDSRTIEYRIITLTTLNQITTMNLLSKSLYSLVWLPAVLAEVFSERPIDDARRLQASLVVSEEDATCRRVFSLNDGPVVADCQEAGSQCSLVGDFARVQHEGIELLEEECTGDGSFCFGGPGALIAECSSSDTGTDCEMECCSGSDGGGSCIFVGGQPPTPKIDCAALQASVNDRNGVSNTVCECSGLTATCNSDDMEFCFQTTCDENNKCIPTTAETSMVCYIRGLKTYWACDADLVCGLVLESREYSFTQGVVETSTQEFVRIPSSSTTTTDDRSLGSCVNFYDNVECNSCAFCQDGASIALDCSNIQTDAILDNNSCADSLPVVTLVSDLVGEEQIDTMTTPTASPTMIAPPTSINKEPSGSTSKGQAVTAVSILISTMAISFWQTYIVL